MVFFEIYPSPIAVSKARFKSELVKFCTIKEFGLDISGLSEIFKVIPVSEY